ncbi:MAG: hypothetical protein HY298_10775 [Verrucomicrobia bacterium]|nr:hypothetical protein [Verrucomicrobiota bacterium]
MITQEQMELGLDKACGFQVHLQAPRQLSRAQWWFNQMRRVVDHALDWQPAPPCRPEQIWFAEPQRQTHA